MDYHASLKALDEEITKLSAAFAAANEALGRITYLAGNLKRAEADKVDAAKKPTCTNDLGNKPEVAQSVSAGAGRSMTYKDIVDELLKRSKFDIPRKFVKFRPFEDDSGDVFLEISMSDTSQTLGCMFNESFSIHVEGMESMVEQFDDNVESMLLTRFREKKSDHHEWERL